MAFPFSAFIDWNRSGDFILSDENVTNRVRIAGGLSWSRGKDTIQERAPAAAGELTAVLANESRDYSPGNSSSPIWPNAKPSCLVRLTSAAIAGGFLALQDATDLELQSGNNIGLQGSQSRNLWTGLLDDMSQNPERENKSVGIRCLGTLSRLVGRTVTTQLYENVTIDQAIGYVLDAAGWPALERDLQVSSVTLRYFWADGDAFQTIEALRITEALWASVYENGDGWIVFENQGRKNDADTFHYIASNLRGKRHGSN